MIWTVDDWQNTSYLKCGVNQQWHMSRNTQYQAVNIKQMESEKAPAFLMLVAIKRARIVHLKLAILLSKELFFT